VHIFLSYSHDDLKDVLSLQSALNSHGFSTYMDTRITIGDYWDVSIEKALAESYAVVACWTARSVLSRYVRLECRYGLRHKRLTPVFLSKCMAPLEFSDIEGCEIHKFDNRFANKEFENLIDRLTMLKDSYIESLKLSENEKEIYRQISIAFLTGKCAPKDIDLATQWAEKSKK
jgi:hypothetical protein